MLSSHCKSGNQTLIHWVVHTACNLMGAATIAHCCQELNKNYDFKTTGVKKFPLYPDPKLSVIVLHE